MWQRGFPIQRNTYKKLRLAFGVIEGRLGSALDRLLKVEKITLVFKIKGNNSPLERGAGVCF